MAVAYYEPRFIDESMTFPDKKGRSFPTGKLSGFVIGRSFSKSQSGKITAKRLVLSFSWDNDTQDAKATALAKVIEGMQEMPELEENPPLTWIPPAVKLALADPGVQSSPRSVQEK